MMYAGIVRENLKVYGELRDRIFMSYKYLECFYTFLLQSNNIKAAIEIWYFDNFFYEYW